MKQRMIGIVILMITLTTGALAQDISAKPWLRTVLPEQTLAYLRVPNLWGVLGAPKGTALDTLQSAPANAALFAELRAGLQNTWLTPLSDVWGAVPELLLGELSSPLEAAALMPVDETAAGPQVLLTGTLQADTLAAAQAVLERIISSEPQLQWGEPLNDAGEGLILIMGQPVQVYYQLPEQRLFMLGGVELVPAALSRLSTRLQTRSNHPMYALEAEIDASGQGLFLWIDAASAAQIAASVAPPPVLMMLQLSGALEIQQLAMGMGASAGKSRTKLVALMPPTGFRRFLPVPDAALTVAAVEAISTAGVLALPSVTDWRAFKQLLQQLSPEAATELTQAEQAMQEYLGFDIEDWWQTIGPEWLYIDDAAGQYGALRIRDWARFEAMTGHLIEQFGLGFEQRQINDISYSHLTIPSFYNTDDEFADLANDRLIGVIMKLSQAATHVYWKQENDYLILASVPQVLIDRDALKPELPVGDWLTQQIKLPSENAVFAVATQADGIPSMFYQWHLQMLQYLGDIVERPVDLFDLPTPRQVELPASGGYGFKLGSGADRLELELLYETNPMELLFAGNTMTSIAVAGILAAVAIPAYQDYRVRAEVTQSFEEIQRLQSLLEGFYADNGRFPAAEEFTELANSVLIESYAIADLAFDPVTAQLSIVLAAPDEVYGESVFLNAEVLNGQINWQCATDSYQTKLYPAECR